MFGYLRCGKVSRKLQESRDPEDVERPSMANENDERRYYSEPILKKHRKETADEDRQIDAESDVAEDDDLYGSVLLANLSKASHVSFSDLSFTSSGSIVRSTHNGSKISTDIESTDDPMIERFCELDEFVCTIRPSESTFSHERTNR